MRPVTKLGPAATAAPTALSCADCPGHLIRVSPWQWPPFTLVRFFRNGRPLDEGAFRASRTPGDATLQRQMQLRVFLRHDFPHLGFEQQLEGEQHVGLVVYHQDAGVLGNHEKGWVKRGTFREQEI